MIAVTTVTMNPPTPDTWPQRWQIKFRFDGEIVDLIKDLVPWQEREWDADARCWWLDPEWLDALTEELEALGHTVRRATSGAHAGPPPPEWAQPSWAEVMLTAVGPERREAVFRALSRVLHPDVENGDAGLMRTLLQAREIVVKMDAAS